MKDFLRYFLFPFALLFWIVSIIRNIFYEVGVFKTYKIPEKAIVIGNLSVGGTGKTPMTAWLTDLFKTEHHIAILSRGYGRKTKGFVEVSEDHQFLEVGDEPLMYKKHFGNDVGVYVCEDRTVGISEIRKRQSIDLLLLDDAFQHRKVEAGFSILLTDFSKPFFRDFLLPTGTLREAESGKNRADILIFTKCPSDLENFQKKTYIEEAGIDAENVFFSSIKYGAFCSFGDKNITIPKHVDKILLVTGLANPQPLERFLRRKYDVEAMHFGDHHAFSEKDLEKIHKKFDTFVTQNKVIVTSEKDYMRFSHPNLLKNIDVSKWFYQPIELEFDRENELKQKVKQYVGKI